MEIHRVIAFVLRSEDEFLLEGYGLLRLIPSQSKIRPFKALKDYGISVISVQDLLAWRKGEKAIPSKSAVITIDDEWNSQYYVAWPIIKEFGYPFTLFVYTQWVNTGGKAMTWAQLGEMRDAGVDTEAHTVSHHDLRHNEGRGVLRILLTHQQIV